MSEFAEGYSPNTSLRMQALLHTTEVETCLSGASQTEEEAKAALDAVRRPAPFESRRGDDEATKAAHRRERNREHARTAGACVPIVTCPRVVWFARVADSPAACAQTSKVSGPPIRAVSGPTAPLASSSAACRKCRKCPARIYAPFRARHRRPRALGPPGVRSSPAAPRALRHHVPESKASRTRPTARVSASATRRLAPSPPTPAEAT